LGVKCKVFRKDGRPLSWFLKTLNIESKIQNSGRGRGYGQTMQFRGEGYPQKADFSNFGLQNECFRKVRAKIFFINSSLFIENSKSQLIPPFCQKIFWAV